MSNDTKIPVWVSESSTSKSALPSVRKAADDVIPVTKDVIANNIRSFIEEFQNSVDLSPKTGDRFVVSEIELTLAVNASGGIELVGKLNAGAQAGIKVKLKLRED